MNFSVCNQILIIFFENWAINLKIVFKKMNHIAGFK